LSASEAGAAEKSRREKAYTEVAENTAITEKRKTLNAWIVRTWGAGVLRPYKGGRNPRAQSGVTVPQQRGESVRRDVRVKKC
jgi:hypothetical protein